MDLFDKALRARVNSKVKESLSLHFNAFYKMREIDMAEDDGCWRWLGGMGIWIGIFDFKKAVACACVEFRTELDLAWRARAQHLIWNIFCFGNQQQQYAAGIAMRSCHNEIDKGTFGEFYLQAIYEKLDLGGGHLPRRIQMRLDKIVEKERRRKRRKRLHSQTSGTAQRLAK